MGVDEWHSTRTGNERKNRFEARKKNTEEHEIE